MLKLLIILIFALILVAIIGYFSIKHPITSVFFILLFSTSIPFILNKLCPSLTGYGNPLVLSIAYIYCGSLIFYNLARKHPNIEQLCLNGVFLCIIITCIYLFFSASYRGIPLNLYLDQFQNNFRALPILLTIGFLGISDKYAKHKFYTLLAVLVLIQAIIGIIQFVGGSEIYTFFSEWKPYVWKGNLVTPVEDFIIFQGRLVSGTMKRYNHYGNFLSACDIYLFGILMFNKSRLHKTLLKGAIFFGIVGIVLSGSRMALISLLFGFSLIGFLKRRNTTLLLLLIPTVLIIMYSSTLRALGIHEMLISKSLNPLQRFAGSFAMLTNPFSEPATVNTLSRMVVLLPYFYGAPLFGSGQYWIGGYDYIYPGSGTITDVTVFYLLLEFGVIGTIIYFSSLIFALKTAIQKSGFKPSIPLLALFLTLSLQTITDPGLFQDSSSYLVCTAIGLELSTKVKLITQVSHPWIGVEADKTLAKALI